MGQSDTRKKLIESAINLFSKEGYFQTKVSDIVKNAGVAQGTFYIYFKSKEDILLTIVKTIIDEIYKTINRYEKVQLEPNEKVLHFSKEIFELLYQYKEIARIFFFQLYCINDEFQQMYYDTSQQIHRFLQQTFNDEVLADILLGFGERLFKFEILMDNKPLEQTVEKITAGIELILKGKK